MDLGKYAVPAVAAATYLLCAVIKGFIGEKSKFLPLIAAGLGVGFAVWSTNSFGFETFLSGLASGLGAVGIDNVVGLGKTLRAENALKETH